MTSKSEENYLFMQIVLVGAKNLWRTMIFSRMMGLDFQTIYEHTLGLDFFKTENFFNNKKINFRIFDIGGLKSYNSSFTTFVSNTNSFILVYDVTRRKSIEDLKYFLDLLSPNVYKNNNENKTNIIVGNKIESHERKISYEEGLNFANRYHIAFMEVSAKCNYNINEMLKYLMNCRFNKSKLSLKKKSLRKKSNF